MKNQDQEITLSQIFSIIGIIFDNDFSSQIIGTLISIGNEILMKLKVDANFS
jgi:hypothetical protein